MLGLLAQICFIEILIYKNQGLEETCLFIMYELLLQATVGFTLFGKETLADINAKEIVAEMS